MHSCCQLSAGHGEHVAIINSFTGARSNGVRVKRQHHCAGWALATPPPRLHHCSASAGARRRKGMPQAGSTA